MIRDLTRLPTRGRTMEELVTPEQLPRWVPGEITAASDGLGWRNIALRGYRYLGQDVNIPPMRDFMIVSYRAGDTPMERRCVGPWSKTTCAPGSVSLLTREQASEWHWTENVEVLHVYLREELLRDLAAEALDGAIDAIELRDVLNVNDPVITQAVAAIRGETDAAGLGGSLYAEAVGTQLGLHLLRNYATVNVCDRADHGGLSPAQRRRVDECIDAALAEGLDLDALAGAAGLGLATFSRRFRQSFGCAPYAYVIRRRIERARELIERGSLPLKQVAPACGFTDQAHMTRLFRRHLGVTPGRLRRDARR